MTTPPDQAFRPRSDFLRTLTERGFLHQCTDLAALDARLCAGPVAAYIGFDLTADSLHVGHLIPIMMLRWLQRTGHKPIVLMGGGTSRIGDPSFRDATRPLLHDAQIEQNLRGVQHTFERFLSFGDGPTDAVTVNNAEWLDRVGYVDFLQTIGRHFSVNRMLSFDSVRLRLAREQSLSLLEFNYMVIQAYDFLVLARTHDCALQMGASDQWGNIVNGVELGRRIEGRELFGLTGPLLAAASGAKMGKSASGAVWLRAERLPPSELWQFWRNTEDADVGRFLRLFTELPLDEIARLEALQGSELNQAKTLLADDVTALCHGRAAADLPTIAVEANRLRAGLQLADLMVDAGLAPSKSYARRLMRGGGARVNDAAVADETARLTDRDIRDGTIKLSAGRKRHALVRLV